ncbi:transcriptional regulator [Methylobacterium sp. Leaf456]|nr:transcriptional regulator [Methylobacterium sp. Leaf456]
MSPWDSLYFAGCPDLIGTPFSYAREEEIYGEAEEAEFVYKLLDGAVRTHKILSDGRRQITGFHLPGELLGFEQQDRHRHAAEALTDTRMLIFRRRQIERMAACNATVACQLWSLTARRLRDAQDHMLLLGRGSAMERLVAFLIDLDLRLGATGTFVLPMSRRDIADYLGLTIETVSRLMTQLEVDGALLRCSGRQLSLHRTHLDRLIAF